MNIAEKKWMAILVVSMVVSLLGLFNAWKGGSHYWLGWVVVSFFAPGICIALIQMYRPRVASERRQGFVIKKSPWAAISYLILCGCWFLGLMYLGIMRPEALWIIAALMFLCALGTLAALWQFFDPRPITVINEDGFYDRNLRVGTIPWSQITGAAISIVQGTEVISLQVKDPKLLCRKQSAARLFDWLDQLVGFELLHLGLIRLDADFMDEALDYILARCASSVESEPKEDKNLEGLMALAEH